jgi:hypothetical protein
LYPVRRFGGSIPMMLKNSARRKAPAAVFAEHRKYGSGKFGTGGKPDKAFSDQFPGVFDGGKIYLKLNRSSFFTTA